MGVLSAVLEASCLGLGPSWGPRGLLWGSWGRLLGAEAVWEPAWDRPGAVSEGPWGSMGPSWGSLGASVGRLSRPGSYGGGVSGETEAISELPGAVWSCSGPSGACPGPKSREPRKHAKTTENARLWANRAVMEVLCGRLGGLLPGPGALRELSGAALGLGGTLREAFWRSLERPRAVLGGLGPSRERRRLSRPAPRARGAAPSHSARTRTR